MVIEGIVEQGKHLGRRLGFPTANINPLSADEPWPVNGVYAAALWVEGDTRARLGMLNQGVHPTVPEGKPTIEIHLPDFHEDIYGQPVRVEYLRFLRPERRFDSLDALIAQLERDRGTVTAWLSDALSGADGSAAAERAREIQWHRYQ